MLKAHFNIIRLFTPLPFLRVEFLFFYFLHACCIPRSLSHLVLLVLLKSGEDFTIQSTVIINFLNGKRTGKFMH